MSHRGKDKCICSDERTDGRTDGWDNERAYKHNAFADTVG